MSVSMKLLFFSVTLASLSLKTVNPQNFSLQGLNASNKETTTVSPKQKEVNDIVEEWKSFDRNIKRYVNEAIKMVLPVMMERFQESNMNISSSCIKDALKIVSGLKASKVWAFSILDASGKAIDGLLTGSLASLGEYEQCLNIEAINERRGRNYGQILFRGKYCALDIRPHLPPKKSFYRIDEVIEELKNFSETGTVGAEIAKAAHFFYFLAMRIGLCVPSGCSKEDISSIAANALGRYSWTADVKRCEMKDEGEITPLMKGCWGIFGFFGLLVVIGTIVDRIYAYREKKIKGKGVKILTTFSFVTNYHKLIDTSMLSEPLGCLSGIRVLSITWIILGHTYMVVNYQLFRGLKQAIAYKDNFPFQVVINAAVAVDSFFFISGLVMCHSTIKFVKKMKRKFSIGLYIFHRVWRLLPLYALVMAFVFMTPLFGSGPIWHDTLDPQLENCYKNWWTNLVFLNNYVDPENICLLHSWYVACDMQLYLFSLIIILPLLRWPKVGISLAVFCTFASMIATALIHYLNSFPPTMLFVHADPKQRENFLPKTYYTPYPHAAPYFMGILVGYFLMMKPDVFRFSKVIQIVGWCVAIVCSLSAVYGVYGWNTGNVPAVWESVFYSGCHRAAWALGLGWVIICCATGQGGIAHYILTWNVWVPISRLTYAVYLLHPIIQMLFLGNIRMKLQPKHDLAIWVYFGHCAVSYGTAFAFSMLIEAPTLAMANIFLQRRKPQEDRASRKTQINAKGAGLPNGCTNGSTDNNETHICNETQNSEVCRL